MKQIVLIVCLLYCCACEKKVVTGDIETEIAQSCLNLKSLSLRLADLLKERDSLSFWSNVDFAMNTNKEIKSLS